MLSKDDTHRALYALQQVAILARNDPVVLKHAPSVSRAMDCMEIMLFYLASESDRTRDFLEQLKAIDGLPGFRGAMAAMESTPEWHGRDPFRAKRS